MYVYIYIYYIPCMNLHIMYHYVISYIIIYIYKKLPACSNGCCLNPKGCEHPLEDPGMCIYIIIYIYITHDIISIHWQFLSLILICIGRRSRMLETQTSLYNRLKKHLASSEALDSLGFHHATKIQVQL